MTKANHYKAAAELEREALHRGLLSFMEPRSASRLENRLAWASQVTYTREPRTPKIQRPRCGAKTRRGPPCRARAVSGATRCRMHGGLSTGARTEAGRAAIAESNRRRAVLRDLAELAGDVAEDRRRQWAAAIVVLSRDYPERNHDGDVRGAVLAAGVSVRTIHRWRLHPGFREAERRANARQFRCWRDARRREAREESMYTLDTPLPDFDLDKLPAVEDLLDFEIPELDDLKLPDLEFSAEDLDALLADVELHLAELPTLDLEKLLEGLELPDVEDLA